MGQSINKKSKAERQAETGEAIRRAREEQAKNAGKPFVADISADDEDLEDLLGAAPPVVARSRSAVVKTKPERTVVPRIRQEPMVRFITNKGEEIIGPGVRYYVVKDSTGRLHYKQEASVFVLPDGWQDGDPIPEAATIIPPALTKSKPAIAVPAELRTPGLEYDDDLL